MKKPLQLTVNGDLRQVLVEPYYSLLDALRDEIRLTGTNETAAVAILKDGGFSAYTSMDEVVKKAVELARAA